MDTTLTNRARELAQENHTEHNLTLDEQSYLFHLDLVADYVIKYKHHVANKDLSYVIAAAYAHDLMADCNVNLKYMQSILGKEVAMLVLAMTCPGGKDKDEITSCKYYKILSTTQYGTFLKLCDRLAKVNYTVKCLRQQENKNGAQLKYKKYQQDLPNLILNLGHEEEYSDMYEELKELIIKPNKLKQS